MEQVNLRTDSRRKIADLRSCGDWYEAAGPGSASPAATPRSAVAGRRGGVAWLRGRGWRRGGFGVAAGGDGTRAY